MPTSTKWIHTREHLCWRLLDTTRRMISCSFFLIEVLGPILLTRMATHLCISQLCVVLKTLLSSWWSLERTHMRETIRIWCRTKWPPEKTFDHTSQSALSAYQMSNLDLSTAVTVTLSCIVTSIAKRKIITSTSQSVFSSKNAKPKLTLARNEKSKYQL